MLYPGFIIQFSEDDVMKEKSGLKNKSKSLTLVLMAIVAIIALAIIISNANEIKSNPVGAAVRNFEKGSCIYEDGYITGCPCANPSGGVIIPEAPLVKDYCK